MVNRKQVHKVSLPTDQELKKRFEALKGPTPTDEEIKKRFEALSGKTSFNPVKLEKDTRIDEKKKSLEVQLELKKVQFSNNIQNGKITPENLIKNIKEVTAHIKRLEEVERITKLEPYKKGYQLDIEYYKAWLQELNKAIPVVQQLHKSSANQRVKSPQQIPAKKTESTTLSPTAPVDMLSRARTLDKQSKGKTNYENHLKKIIHLWQNGHQNLAKAGLASFKKILEQQEAIQRNSQIVSRFASELNLLKKNSIDSHSTKPQDSPKPRGFGFK